MRSAILFLCSFYLHLDLHENTLYVFCRGTATKAGLIAKKYNVSDSVITHTGIGYFIQGKAKIFHVTDDRSAQNALRVGSFESFASVPGITHLSIWKIPMERKAFHRIKAVLKEVSAKQIYFDTQFSLTNKPDSLYCAEFCAIVLRAANKHCTPTIFGLDDELAIKFLGRKVLTYFPADFFLQIKGVQNIYSWTKDQ